MAKLQICIDPDVLGNLFAAANPSHFPNWDHHPLYGCFGRSLGAAINASRQQHKFAHFAIIDSDEPILLAPATCDGNTVSMFGNALVLAVRKGMGQKRQKQAYSAAFQKLLQIASKHGAATIHILGSDSCNMLEATDLACIDQGARPESHLHGIINTSQDEKAIHRQLRNSYRSLVNWGRQKLTSVYINTENPDRRLFDLYSAFHAKIASAAHYNDAYWNTYWDEIIAGRGELSLGHLEDGQLATGTLVVDAGKTAYYASGVYDRELFDKPLGHFPVFDSIIRASTRGMIRYDLGEIFPSGMASEKEIKIGFFKKGFTSTYLLRTIWILDGGSNSTA